MAILLVRHGDAMAAGVHGDAPRALSARGRGETVSVGEAVRAAGLTPTAFVTSPLVRAVQTAELLARVVSYEGVVNSEPALVPDADPGEAARRLVDGTGLLVVVCHEPIVRGIAALLTGRPSHPPFRTSGAVLLGDGPGLRSVLRTFEP